jgi:hypothetical protein
MPVVDNDSMDIDQTIQDINKKEPVDNVKEEKAYESRVSKVQELLRQSRETAFNLNKDDLDKKFNFKKN